MADFLDIGRSDRRMSNTPLPPMQPMNSDGESNPDFEAGPVAVALPAIHERPPRNPLGGGPIRCARRGCVCCAPLPYDLETRQPLKLLKKIPVAARDYIVTSRQNVYERMVQDSQIRRESRFIMSQLSVTAATQPKDFEVLLMRKRSRTGRQSMRRSVVSGDGLGLITGTASIIQEEGGEGDGAEQADGDGCLAIPEESSLDDAKDPRRRFLASKSREMKRAGTHKTPLGERMYKLEMRAASHAQEARIAAVKQEQTDRYYSLPEDKRTIIEAAYTDVVGDTSGDIHKMMTFDEVCCCCVELGLRGANSLEKQEINQATKDAVIEAAICSLRWIPMNMNTHEPTLPHIHLFELATRVLPLVRHKLVELRSADLLKEFYRHDFDRDGKLCSFEVLAVARTLGLDQRVLLMAVKDEEQGIDPDQFIDIVMVAQEDFERALRERERDVRDEEGLEDEMFIEFRNDLISLNDNFKRYAARGTNVIDMDTMMLMLKECGLMPAAAAECTEVEYLLETAEKEVDKQFNFKEFLVVVKKIREYRQELIRDEQLASFEHYDKDHGGDLSVAEISMLLHDLGIAPRNRTEQSELATMIFAADEDGSGTIDFAEFQDLCQRIDEKLKQIRYEQELDYAMRNGFTEQHMRDFRFVFDALDSDGSGHLSLQEVHSCLSHMQKAISWDVIETAYNKQDADGSGELDFFEFIELMQSLRDQEGIFSEEPLQLEQAANKLELRVLRRALEQFRISKAYLISKNRNDIVQMFCSYLNVQPTENLHKALNISSVKELYDVAKVRNVEMQHHFAFKD